MNTEIDIEGHVLYALRNARVHRWPFPHFYAENIFPETFYWQLLDELARKDDYFTQGDLYKGRTFAKTDALPDLEFMKTREFLREVCSIFGSDLQERFTGRNLSVYNDLRLVRDGIGYSIGPHTDAPWKLVSLLFYLPQDGWHARHGTSIYLPADPEFRCTGGPHYPFEGFKRISTAPYLPNACFGFLKTDNSFHGVEPIDSDFNFKRDVLLYNVYDQQLYLQSRKPAKEQPS